jgi:hypothetical protein
LPCAFGCHPGTAAIIPAVVHARRAFGLLFFPCCQPKRFFRCQPHSIPLERQLRFRRALRLFPFGNIHSPGGASCTDPGGIVPPQLSSYLRDHWKIENSQHYILHVTFSEDASRIRKGSAPEISGAFRRMALNILQRDTTLKDSIRGKRLRAGWDETILDEIYSGFHAV